MTTSTTIRGASSRSLKARCGVLLMLAIACALLILPTVAGATVDKQHAKAYRGRVTGLTRSMTGLVKAYNSYSTGLADLAEQMKPLIGSVDPHDQELLRLLQQNANVEFAAYKSVLGRMASTTEDLARGLPRMAKTWFSDPADKIDLRRGVNKFANGTVQVGTAFAHLGLGYKALGVAADIDEARAQNDAANKLTPSAYQRQTAGLNILRDLQR
jgi:hypothetical protein